MRAQQHGQRGRVRLPLPPHAPHAPHAPCGREAANGHATASGQEQQQQDASGAGAKHRKICWSESEAARQSQRMQHKRGLSPSGDEWGKRGRGLEGGWAREGSREGGAWGNGGPAPSFRGR